MTAVMKKGLYYSYIITSQSYSAVKLISNNNSFNKLNIIVKLVNAIIGAECYTDSDAFFLYNQLSPIIIL